MSNLDELFSLVEDIECAELRVSYLRDGKHTIKFGRVTGEGVENYATACNSSLEVAAKVAIKQIKSLLNLEKRMIVCLTEAEFEELAMEAIISYYDAGDLGEESIEYYIDDFIETRLGSKFEILTDYVHEEDL